MIGLLIAVLTYITFASTGYLGGDIIYALDVLENWYWFIAIIVSIIVLLIVVFFMVVGGAAFHSTLKSKLGAWSGILSGGLFGFFISSLIFLKIIVQLWITTWLISNIDPLLIDINHMPDKQVVALSILTLLAFIPFNIINKIDNKS